MATLEFDTPEGGENLITCRPVYFRGVAVSDIPLPIRVSGFASMTCPCGTTHEITHIVGVVAWPGLDGSSYNASGVVMEFSCGCRHYSDPEKVEAELENIWHSSNGAPNGPA
jgi:hypothetical protein